MTVDQVINYFGTKAEIAKRLNISYQAVQQWTESGKVPKGRQFELQILSDGQLTVDNNAKQKAA